MKRTKGRKRPRKGTNDGSTPNIKGTPEPAPYGGRKISDLLSMPDSEDIDFEPPRLRLKLKPVDFS